MCTSIRFNRTDHYFGRTLDVEFSFHEQVVITPRRRVFHLKNGTDLTTQYALIGIAAVQQDIPLYYEAANEAGLAMAGLNFPGLACYHAPKEGFDNITPSELLSWILGQASTLAEARQLLTRLNLTNQTFAPDMPLSPLHFMLSDASGSLVIEPTTEGIQVYDNPYGVMTNAPDFHYHSWNLQQYLHLSPHNQDNQFSAQYPLQNYAVGMGAVGLPGDCSSASRFVRAAFNLANSNCPDTEADNVTQFFHVLDSVSMVKGAVLTDSGKNDITRYSCCINTTKGIFYYKTYDNNQINAIHLDHADLDGDKLIVYDLRDQQQIYFQN